MSLARHQLAVIDNASPTTVEASSPSYAHFINRDLSLLEFFRSVLEEGRDESIALLERLKFLAIFASNLDEFFMIRVSGLKEKLRDHVEVWPDGYNRPELMKAIRQKVLELSSMHTDCLVNDVLPALANKGVVLDSYEKLSADERAKLDVYFDEQISPVLTPQAVDPTHPFPYISGGSVNIGLYIKPKLSERVARRFAKIGDEFFVRIKIPTFLSRFVPVGEESDTRFVLIEDIIRANIHKITPGADGSKCHLFRITRDGDIDIRESETEDLLETMEENLKERRFGDVVRLEVSKSMPQETIEYLKKSLKIEADDVYAVDGPMNVAEFWTLVGLDRPDLKEAKIRSKELEVLKKDESIFEVIKREDVLLHHPYNPYSTVTDMIRQAADDPDVLAIKMCLYRIGENSPIAPELIRASEKGKQVTAWIEIKARFDEAYYI